MKKRVVENTLFLGNGFSRTVFQDMPSWGDLFDGVNKSTDNYTILYEISRLSDRNRGRDETAVKEDLIQRIKATFSEKSIRRDIRGLEEFGVLLQRNNISNIITTNYDNGIECILYNKCGYREWTQKSMTPERVYSIRTYKILYNDDTGHSVKLWKIHGDFERIKSVTLGYDQYCGALSRLINYVKGNYKSSQSENRIECKVAMKEKCLNQNFDNISWVELFFRTNLYIVGFGLEFSEIDIWWLINKRARYMLEVPALNNTITYVYNEQYENEEKKPAIFSSLRAFDVRLKPVNADANYISNIFKCID